MIQAQNQSSSYPKSPEHNVGDLASRRFEDDPSEHKIVRHIRMDEMR